jgi:predicted DCC family thiol-disulfide oxidoreductase YuxK
MSSDADHPILLFDGVCNLCNRLLQFVIERDEGGYFRFASLQSAAGQEQLERFGLPTEDFDTFVRIDGDEYTTKSTAALLVLRDLGFPWSLLYPFIVVPKVLRDPVYDLVAWSRYDVWGRKDRCMIPTDDVEARFLEGSEPVVERED